MVQNLPTEINLDIEFLNFWKVYKIGFNSMCFDRYLVQIGTNHCAEADSFNGHEVNWKMECCLSCGLYEQPLQSSF